jgi:hypothetical protein
MMARIKRRFGDTNALAFLRTNVRSMPSRVLFLQVILAVLFLLLLFFFPFNKIGEIWFYLDTLTDFFFLLPAVVIAMLFTYPLYKITQLKKDHWAGKHYHEVLARTDSKEPVFLYLRSFTAAARFSRQAPYENIEAIISELLSAHGHPFIAIGNRDRSFGAAKAKLSDETWQSVVLRLMDRSEVIFFMPGSSPSAQWEAGQIFGSASLLSKTAWLMPGRKKNGWQWKAVSKAFWDALGVRFPAHQPTGGIFLIDSDKKHTSVVSNDIFIDCLTKVLESTGKDAKNGVGLGGDLLTKTWRLIGV